MSRLRRVPRRLALRIATRAPLPARDCRVVPGVSAAWCSWRRVAPRRRRGAGAWLRNARAQQYGIQAVNTRAELYKEEARDGAR